MILNQTPTTTHIVRFAAEPDAQALAHLKSEVEISGNRKHVVVLDCTGLDVFSDAALDDLLALRRQVERLGVGKTMVAIRQRTRFGQSITRLIPASLRILIAQLPRYAGQPLVAV